MAKRNISMQIRRLGSPLFQSRSWTLADDLIVPDEVRYSMIVFTNIRDIPERWNNWM
jgi:hypothetical protein